MGRRDPDQSIGRQLLVLAIKHTDTRRVRIRQSAASHGTHYTHTVHIVARKKSKTNARRWKLAPAKSTRRDTTTTKKKGWSALSSYLSTGTQSTRRKRRTWPAFSFWLSGSFGNTRRRRRTKMTAETMSSSPTSTDSYYPRIPVVCVYPFDWSCSSRDTLLLHSWWTHPPFLINSWLLPRILYAYMYSGGARYERCYC